MKIKVIIPNSHMKRAVLDERERMLAPALSAGTRLSVDCIEDGPREVASHTDEALAEPWLLKAGLRAQSEGYDAMVVYCFSDPGIDLLREQLDIPVIGPGEISLAMASMIGERCGIITTTEANISRITGRIRRESSIRDHFWKVYALDIPVLGLQEDASCTQKRLEEICSEAVKKDRIDTIVFGCLGMADYGAVLEKQFSVAVLDPAFIGVAYAEMCARLRIRGSRRKYQRAGKAGLE